jgi:hypothetical protein
MAGSAPGKSNGCDLYGEFLDLAVLCHEAAATEEKAIIGVNVTDIAYLLDSAPALSSGIRTRELLACDASLQAVIEVLPGSWGFMLSRSQNGQKLASVFCPHLVEEMTMSGETEALALLGALATTLAATMRSEEVLA